MGEPFYLQKGNIYAVPIIHYTMELAAEVRLAIEELNPDCIAVELAETMSLQLQHAASRLPDISIVITRNKKQQPLYYMVEPCDAAFEALRSAQEKGIAAFCIDLDVDFYPEIQEFLPDPYAIQRIGLKEYYSLYRKSALSSLVAPQDKNRELYMGRRLKELSLSYDKVLFIGGMAHVERVLEHVNQERFPDIAHEERELIEICTLTEKSSREVMAEPGWFSAQYENLRKESAQDPYAFPPDRQKLIYQLYKESAQQYGKKTGNPFPGYHFRNIMKFVRNYAHLTQMLMPNLFQILTAAKGCVDHNYAYEVWELATSYPYLRNVDSLQELDLSIEDVWGHSKIIRFHMREQSRKSWHLNEKRKDISKIRFKPPSPFSICSYPPEDLIIEGFGKFLQKKGTQILTDEGARTIPFSCSIEDGIDTKETIRHWYEKKLYVKTRGKPPGGVGSVVIIFNDDSPQEHENSPEEYPWKTTWIGEHQQESDMAFYATPMTANIVGPGISRCKYGGFMMSYPPRRMYDVWSDPDYEGCRSKAEVLLAAAIDYAVKPIIVYVAAKPPRTALKSFARRFGKKIVYVPIGQLSPITLNKIRTFHVLDGHDKREIADEYIF